MKKTKRSKRKLRFGFKVGLGVVALLILFLGFQGEHILHQIQYPHFDELTDLGYSLDTIQSFHDVLSEEQVLSVLKRPYEEDMLNRFTIAHYDTLRTKGYTQEEVNVILNQTESLISRFEESEVQASWLQFISSNHFIEANLDRYTSYQMKKPELVLDKVLSMVNTQRDYPLYTHIQKADPSKGVLVLVNKYYQLDASYVPQLASAKACGDFQMMPEAASALNQLCLDMQALNLDVAVSNTYRSYDTQVSIYARYLEKDNQNVVDTFSARPGHSEHQAGLAVDFKPLSEDITYFESSDAYPWLKENAHIYGFIERYTQENSIYTGYQAEAWHYRYVGVEVATELYQTNMSFDEYSALNP